MEKKKCWGLEFLGVATRLSRHPIASVGSPLLMCGTGPHLRSTWCHMARVARKSKGLARSALSRSWALNGYYGFASVVYTVSC
jgi:hypothetical protein